MNLRRSAPASSAFCPPVGAWDVSKSAIDTGTSIIMFMFSQLGCCLLSGSIPVAGQDSSFTHGASGATSYVNTQYGSRLSYTCDAGISGAFQIASPR